jgi:sarcosine oxidase subunit alpha
MVGHRLSPMRVLPAHERHLALGAVMADYGPWLRPAAYPRPGEDEHAAVIREVRATRTAAGLFDASPLGKIEVKGRDAAEFLNRMYVNSLKALKLGACRYALMLSELGHVYDDGVVARLAEDHFLVGATSGHASAVAAGFQEWLQGEWPDLDVVTEDVTTAWAVMNVVGPKSREILAKLEIDIDLSREAFPHMTLRLGRIGDIPVRIQRVSFTGELSYEVAAPSGYGAALWDSLMRLGASEGLTPFGIEALTCMRIEKGYLHIGADTDGATLPQDIGFAELIAKKKDDFIGRRSTLLPDGMRSHRRQIVGLEATDSAAPLSIGAHIGASSEKQSSDGWVTSSTFSPTLNRPLAMALLTGGRARLGESVRIYDLGQWRSARVVAPGWYDPEGLRLDV